MKELKADSSLKLEHLAPYLPYKLRILTHGIETTIFSLNPDYGTIKFIDKENEPYNTSLERVKPILRPLSDLSKDDLKEELYQYYESLGITVKLVQYDSGNDNPFDMTLTVTYKMMGEVFTDVLINRGSTSETPYHIFNWLCEKHLDVSGLIPKGLAIDKNTIK